MIRATAQPAGLLSSNVRVFDAATGTFSETAGILIRDGRIHAVGSLRELGSPPEEIDARGAFALPGLWDSHVHLDFASLEGPDAVRKTLEGFVQAGVLYLRDVGGPLEAIAAIRDRVQTREIAGPEIFFSGPLAERPPLFWAQYNEKLPGVTVPIESEAQVDGLVAAAGAYFCPTLHVAEAWRTEHPSLPGFTPEIPEHHWNGFADVATRITQVFAERGVKLLIGQDGADPAGTVREMELLVRIGVPPVDVLRAATLHPAQWLKRDHEMGSLEVGRRGDLVLVGADPLVEMTTLRSPVLVVQGGTIRRRGDLGDRVVGR